MTDSLERFLEDLRFEVPAGLAHRAKAAAAAGERPHRRDVHWQRQPWALTLVAGLLALAIIATLILGARSLRSQPPVPSNTVPKALLPAEPIPPAIAANGWIAYSTSSRTPGGTDTRTGSDIFIVRPGINPSLIAGRDGGKTRNICPAFSPDGRRLAYGVETATGRAIVVVGIDANGAISASVRLPVAGSGSTACPRWSADGRRVAYLDRGAVVVRGLDGSTLAGVAGDPSVQDFGREYNQPLLSPQGDRIAQVQANGGGCWIVVSRPDDTSPIFIPLDFPQTCGYALPSWSPDGRQVLVMEDVSGLDVTMAAVEVESPFQIVTIVSWVALNGGRSFPGWGDVSWQPILPPSGS